MTAISYTVTRWLSPLLVIDPPAAETVMLAELVAAIPGATPAEVRAAGWRWWILDEPLPVMSESATEAWQRGSRPGFAEVVVDRACRRCGGTSEHRRTCTQKAAS